MCGLDWCRCRTAARGKGAAPRALSQLRPDAANAYSHRGFAYGQKGDFKRAMEDLEKAIALDPKYARGYSNRAAILLLRGDRDRAAADFQTALKIYPAIAAAADVKKLQATLTSQPPAAKPNAPAAAPAVIAAPPSRRVALVIGMNAYTAVKPLLNPVGDGRQRRPRRRRCVPPPGICRGHRAREPDPRRYG
jgi:tetratricopeptide (TPR) repeat protein